MTRMRGFLALGACGFTLAACATTTPEQRADSPRDMKAAEVNPPTFPDEGPYESRKITLALGDGLDDCGYTQAQFDFDEAKVQMKDRGELEALAVCLQSPKYEHLDLKLVGRADPRGSKRYNRKLGLERAKAVKQVLVGYGVSPDRIAVATRGEAGAKGNTNEFSFGWDRRVDVVQLNVVHAP